MVPRFGILAGGVQDAIPHAMNLSLFILEFRATGTMILVECLLHAYASAWAVVREPTIDYRLYLMTAINHPMETHAVTALVTRQTNRSFFVCSVGPGLADLCPKREYPVMLGCIASW